VKGLSRKYTGEEEEEEEKYRNKTESQIAEEVMSVEDKVTNWGRLEASETPLNEQDRLYADEKDIDMLEDDAFDFPDQNLYRQTLVDSSAYQWLISSLHRESNMRLSGPNAAGTLRKSIVQKLGRIRHISYRTTPRVSEVVFEIHLNLFIFFEMQQHDLPAGEALPKVITLTGYGDNVQAMTCFDYVAQTWPQAGPTIVNLLGQLLNEKSGNPTGRLFYSSIHGVGLIAN
jgi:hypothetical protein